MEKELQLLYKFALVSWFSYFTIFIIKMVNILRVSQTYSFFYANNTKSYNLIIIQVVVS